MLDTCVAAAHQLLPDIIEEAEDAHRDAESPQDIVEMEAFRARSECFAYFVKAKGFYSVGATYFQILSFVAPTEKRAQTAKLKKSIKRVLPVTVDDSVLGVRV